MREPKYVPFNRTRARSILNKRALPQLYAVADKHRTDRREILTMALVSYERSILSYDGRRYKPTDEFELALNEIVERALAEEAAQPPGRKTDKRVKSASVLKNVQQVVRNSNVLIAALQEALDYDPSRQHNQRPPLLWRDDQKYLDDVKKLLNELRQLTALLETTKPRKAEAARTASRLSKHFDKFLQSYAGAMGKVAAGLTSAAIVAVLYHAGLGKEVIDSVWGRLR
jgi:hypothetical protein